MEFYRGKKEERLSRNIPRMIGLKLEFCKLANLLINNPRGMLIIGYTPCPIFLMFSFKYRIEKSRYSIFGGEHYGEEKEQ